MTDAIIRTCLNIDGSNQREKGFYFDVSNDKPYINFNFQRETPPDKIESMLDREITDEEIDRAKLVLF